MRLIFKALLVLACLIPTLPAAGADFIRIERNENRDPAALQTAIAKYVPAGGQQGVKKKGHNPDLHWCKSRFASVEFRISRSCRISSEGRREKERQPSRHAPAGHEAFPAAGTST